MGEGLIYKPVDNAALDAELRLLAENYLLANGDTDIKVLSTQIEYSNYRGYSYQVFFEANGCEEGLLNIRYNQPGNVVIEEV